MIREKFYQLHTETTTAVATSFINNLKIKPTTNNKRKKNRLHLFESVMRNNGKCKSYHAP